MKHFILFVLLLNSSIAMGERNPDPPVPDPLGHEGGWSQEDQEADGKYGRGLELPPNWPALADWTSISKIDQDALTLQGILFGHLPTTLETKASVDHAGHSPRLRWQNP